MMLTAVALADELDAIAGRLRAQKSMPELTISYENFDDLVFFASYHFAVELKPLLNPSIQLDSIVRRSIKRAFSDCKFVISE